MTEEAHDYMSLDNKPQPHTNFMYKNFPTRDVSINPHIFVGNWIKEIKTNYYLVKSS